MVWKVVNIADTGTASKFGADDTDKINKGFSGFDVDDYDINSDFLIRSGKLRIGDSDNSHYYLVVGSNLSANRTITYPLLTNDDIPVFQAHAQTLTNKTIDIKSNPLALRENSYLIFKDGSTYYSVNYLTGAINSNAAFSTVFQAIIDSIASFSPTVFTKIKIAPGIYDVNTEIDIIDKYNVHVQGAGDQITEIRAGPSLGASARIFDTHGSVSGTSKNLTANGIQRAFTVTVSAGDSTAFAAGDYVLLRSTKAYWATEAANKQGEIKQITAVDTGTGVITFSTPLFDTYNTADTASIIKINFAQNIVFSDLSINKDSGYTGTGEWFHMQFVNSFRLNNITAIDPTGSYDSCIRLQSCINGRINACHFIMNTNATTNEQYGLAILDCSQNITVTNCTSRGRFRHPFEAGTNKAGTNQEGLCRAIVFSACTGSDSHEAIFDTHHMAEGVQFIGCQVLGKRLSYGFQIRSPHTSVNNCYIQGSELDGINLEDMAIECDISNTTIIDSKSDGISLKSGYAVADTRISNCLIKNSVANGIEIQTGVNGTCIKDCTIVDNDADGIDLTNADNCVIEGNIIKNNTGWGIDFEASTCTNEILIGNFFSGNGSGAISDGAQTGNVEVANNGYGFTTATTDSTQTLKNKTFPLTFGSNPDGNSFNGTGITNPYLAATTNATVVRDGIFTAGTSTNTQGLLSGGGTAIGSSTMIFDTTEGLGPRYSTGAVANANAGLRWTTAFMRREWGAYMIVRILPSSTSDIRCFVGWSSDTAEIAGETTLNNFSGAGVGKRAGDTNWFTMVNDGDATEDRVDTGVAFAASAVTIELALNSTNFRSKIGTTTNTAVTTELPAASTDLSIHVEIETGAGAADKNIQIFPIYVRNGPI